MQAQYGESGEIGEQIARFVMCHFMRDREVAFGRRIGCGKILRHRDHAMEKAKRQWSRYLIGCDDFDAIDNCDVCGFGQKIIAHRGVADHLDHEQQHRTTKPDHHR